jgi:hypothetical protein
MYLLASIGLHNFLARNRGIHTSILREQLLCTYTLYDCIHVCNCVLAALYDRVCVCNCMCAKCMGLKVLPNTQNRKIYTQTKKEICMWCMQNVDNSHEGHTRDLGNVRCVYVCMRAKHNEPCITLTMSLRATDAHNPYLHTHTHTHTHIHTYSRCSPVFFERFFAYNERTQCVLLHACIHTAHEAELTSLWVSFRAMTRRIPEKRYTSCSEAHGACVHARYEVCVYACVHVCELAITENMYLL